MYCPKCGTEITERSKHCSSCGGRIKRSANKLLITVTSLIALIGISVSIFLVMQSKQPAKQEVATEVIEKVEEVAQTKIEPEKEPIPEKQPFVEAPKDVSDIIQTSQPKVFTIFTEIGQGSGFLINNNGDVLTNAHVVEGSLNPIVKTMEGTELQGALIGYSNTIDIALIRVPALANKERLPLEENASAEIGDEVIALGSPRGIENTATLGNISGVDRTFVIEPFQYNGIYQTSAPIAPGSSGGPLLSKSTGKVLAINSARHTQEVNIGFSIPLYQIMDTVKQWIHSPMTEDEMTSLFYYQEGEYYYQDYLDDGGYFEDGEYSDEYLEYYEIPDDENFNGDYQEYEYYETDEYDENEEYENGETEEYYDDGYENDDPETDGDDESYETDEYEEDSSVNGNFEESDVENGESDPGSAGTEEEDTGVEDPVEPQEAEDVAE